MKPAKLVVLAFALGAAGLAATLMMRSRPSSAPVVVETKTPVATVDVLVAAADLPTGQTVKPGTTKWAAWPAITCQPAPSAGATSPARSRI
jgi:pilus assembly protein CpaB